MDLATILPTHYDQYVQTYGIYRCPLSSWTSVINYYMCYDSCYPSFMEELTKINLNFLLPLGALTLFLCKNTL